MSTAIERPRKMAIRKERMDRLGDSFWHRLQRSSLYTRMMPAIDMSKGCDTYLAFSPMFYGRASMSETQIRLDAVKQGMYRGSLATFVRFFISHSREYKLRQASYKITLRPSSSTHADTSTAIAAFGPGRLTRPWSHRKKQTAPVPDSKLPRVEVREQDGSLMMDITDHTVPRGFPIYVKLGLVIVHTVPARLTVIPSTGKISRATVLKKTKVYPLDVDLTTTVDRRIQTCGKNDGGPCSEGCAEFDAEHMTPAVWDELLKENRYWDYTGDGPNNVSRLPDWTQLIYPGLGPVYHSLIRPPKTVSLRPPAPSPFSSSLLLGPDCFPSPTLSSVFAFFLWPPCRTALIVAPGPDCRQPQCRTGIASLLDH